MIVAIEGIDAAGKSSVVAALYSHYANHAKFSSVFRMAFPSRGSMVGGVIEDVLRNGIPGTTPQSEAVIIQSLMVADRLSFAKELFLSATNRNSLLILDRYKLSGIAYGVADGLPLAWVTEIQACLPDPDLTVVLNISVKESCHRRPARRDNYESDLQKLETVRSLYVKDLNSVTLDATASLSTLVLQITTLIDALKT